ncbi:choice-of-anchor M domain-containing protein [Phytohabitans sp. ZYX-F-186]|uniref:Choice-of-anchor M domain-containing protein n=1 Tax=Phytohabitans maris TaxID=3071409 RepID=A0ABU0ZSF5_9ACTN|nr:choice-of-anchor M domain-containing protein [Phytohabitans sp. ZYX-F-186]MDQ7909958.1 choice-of-anchor M domain-containing protein [Phytohabitans sp. ZYX-F-186]
MRIRTKILAPLVVAGTLASVAVAAPAQAVPITLTSGHVDVLDLDYNSGALVLRVLDGTGGTNVERNPADVIFRVPLAAKTTSVPGGSEWAFLGTGGTAWILPQDNVSGLLWAGWNADEVADGVFVNDEMTINLTAVSGPAGFSIYTASGGTPTVLFDSGNGLPDAQTVPLEHTHVNWGFDAAGTYTVTFNVTGNKVGGGTVSSGSKQFTFEVLNA